MHPKKEVKVDSGMRIWCRICEYPGQGMHGFGSCRSENLKQFTTSRLENGGIGVVESGAGARSGTVVVCAVRERSTI
ncbi:hypothetical protein Zmor_002573 [Zophobas morio]|uniref:Uncharacterized protein n=1 Tax=Zophobas morio TaxID=2755281 RepID=A0AA38J5L5_9CUCU|nr:hypothetical protein Zmor_002573 [Zophobas morio]